MLTVHGRCHCGQITFEAEVDPQAGIICHCTDCQMLTGAAFRTNIQAEAQNFRLLSGTPKTYVKIAESGNRRLHCFCADCGTPVYACSPENATRFSLRIGTLAERHQLGMARQIWRRSALGWVDRVGEVEAVQRG